MFWKKGRGSVAGKLRTKTRPELHEAGAWLQRAWMPGEAENLACKLRRYEGTK